MNPLSLPSNYPVLAALLLLWILVWKGLALWKSAKNNQKTWFVALLIINTFGLFDIMYLFFFAKVKMRVEELMFWKNLSIFQKKV